MNKPAPVAGLTGIEHIGLTVPDIDAATVFLADVLGAELLYDIGPFERPEEWLATNLVPRPGERIHRLRVLRIANGPVLELFEMTTARRSGPSSAPSTGWHVAFYVEDIEVALIALKAHGCVIDRGPVEMKEGPSAGLAWLYFTAPWGLQLELVSYPGGIAAYKALGQPVWRPR